MSIIIEICSRVHWNPERVIEWAGDVEGEDGVVWLLREEFGGLEMEGVGGDEVDGDARKRQDYSENSLCDI